MPDGCPEEFDKDMATPLHNLSHVSTHSPRDALFTYADTDIDLHSDKLGIPWEASKMIPFRPVVPYLGFIWDLDMCTVAIPEEKKPTHALAEVQRLYGKLLHASLVITTGCAYLTKLEAMLSGFNNSPFVPHTPPCNTSEDLKWWSEHLWFPTLSRNVPGPVPLMDLNAFSDTSPGFSISITIGSKWHAWHLLPGWKADGQDISWSELLVSVRNHPKKEPVMHLKVQQRCRGGCGQR